MQDELGDRARIVGVNAIGEEAGNAEIAGVADLPWLQDTVEVGAWDLWGVEWRDVWVLDAGNHLTAIFNLSEHDLEDPDDYAELRDLITAAEG